MTRRRWLKPLLVVLIVGLPTWWWLCRDGRLAQGADYSLDMAQVRALADAEPGAKAKAVHFEKVTGFDFGAAMVVAGDPWDKTPIPVYSYQIEFPDKTIVVDAAMDRPLAKPDFMVPGYDDGAWRRVSDALEHAELIVVTHEHLDHIGGIVDHPHLSALLPALRLTDEQLAHAERMKPARWPPHALDGYQPLHYERMFALAPGVVLIKAPGHTPGSQLVYVQLADGREMLFLGDVVWHLRNIELQRQRPRFMTMLIGEDRRQVSGEIRALGQLVSSDPRVRLVPGHDGEVVDGLVADGYLAPGFTGWH